MSTSIRPSIPGSACSTCFGIGTTFGNTFTPDYISAIVAGIEKGVQWQLEDGEPGNGSYKLLQIAPNTYQVSIGLYTLSLQWTLTHTIVVLQTGVSSQFISNVPVLCTLNAVNSFQLSSLRFYGGTIEFYL